MNQTTVKDRTKYGIGAEGQNLNWEQINWLSIQDSIRKLRQRIFRATREQKWNQVRSLMKLMLRSYSNLLWSVRLVTQRNRGKRTPGIDNRVAMTADDRVALVREIGQYKAWVAKPVRRIYIPKTDNKTRPLGIPVIRDRAMQAIVKNALEPSWEARFEPHSYGFRPGRGCHDALEQCWRYLNKRGSRVWVLDADIKGAFDNISHDFIMQCIGPVPGRELVKQWLKAGYVEAQILHATETGTPQGGVISPLLLNIALTGMEDLLGPRYGLVRYADDFIVCARTHEEIEAAKRKIEDWLRVRGLMLHPEKTRIVHINDGFNFLALSVRRFRGSCFIRPQKEKVSAFLQSIQRWLSNHRQSPADAVVKHLNPILRGWANYYKPFVSKETFHFVSHRVWQMLWKWSLRRHQNKGKDWVYRKYFRTDKHRSWLFHGDARNAKGDLRRIYLFDISLVPIQRHASIRNDASMDDPSLTVYWRKRRAKRLVYPKEPLIVGA